MLAEEIIEMGSDDHGLSNGHGRTTSEGRDDGYRNWCSSSSTQDESICFKILIVAKYFDIQNSHKIDPIAFSQCFHFCKFSIYSF